MSHHNPSAPKGILLINLGTPDAPDVPAVRRYLKEFLSDPRVIDLPTWARWCLVNGVILPFRPKQSAHAYQQIWRPQGSPLLIYGEQLRDSLRAKLGDDYVVELGMRYGNPSIPNALEKLHGAHCRELTVLPLFPQYSSAATGSAIEKVFVSLAKSWNIPGIKIINDFHDDADFIQSQAKVIKESLGDFKPEMMLFSFHGLPERHIEKSNCSKTHCDRNQACPILAVQNTHCYRGQCYATARALAAELQLPEQQYRVCFQSRLGRTPWITPYTDKTLEDLAKQGVKNIAIACPSFVADCLETLEEIGIRGREQWAQVGGGEFRLVP